MKPKKNSDTRCKSNTFNLAPFSKQNILHENFDWAHKGPKDPYRKFRLYGQTILIFLKIGVQTPLGHIFNLAEETYRGIEGKEPLRALKGP